MSLDAGSRQDPTGEATEALCSQVVETSCKRKRHARRDETKKIGYLQHFGAHAERREGCFQVRNGSSGGEVGLKYGDKMRCLSPMQKILSVVPAM